MLTLNAFRGTAFHGAFSPDGRQIICADMSGRVALYDANTGANLAMLGPDGSNFHFSPGRELAVWCTRGSLDFSGETDTVKLWDVAAGTEVATLTDGKYEFGLLACASSADGPRIAAGSSSGTLRVWDALSGAKLAVIVIADHETPVDGLVFSPDGTRLLSIDGEGAKLWHVGSRSKIATLSFQPFVSVTKFAFSHVGPGFQSANACELRVSLGD